MRNVSKAASAAATVGSVLALSAGTAFADRPVVETESVTGEMAECGNTILTFSGEVTSRVHTHELRNGLFRVVGVFVPRKVTATDEDGNQYRAVGSANFNFLTSTPEGEGGEVMGRFAFRLNLVGKGGRLGDVRFTGRLKRGGEFTFEEKGSCQLIEPAM